MLFQRWKNNIESTSRMYVAQIFTEQWINNETKLCSQLQGLYFFPKNYCKGIMNFVYK